MVTRPFGYIYVITNTENGKFYIGQTRKPVSIRWSEHQSDARLRVKSHFHKAIRKHGGAAFDVQVLATGTDPDDLNQQEALWIFVTNATRYGYNLALGGSVEPHTPEQRANNAAAQKRRTRRPDEIAQSAWLSKWWIGKKRSAANRRAVAQALKGRTPSDACRAAVAEANRRREHSPETRAKLRAAALKGNIGRVYSLETREKLRAAALQNAAARRAKRIA